MVNITDQITDQVKEYYGKQLQGSKDLKTSVCCCSQDSFPNELRTVIPLIAEEILNRFYGCGSPLPPMLQGMTVLDLGCGTGRDVYIASALVGESGRVIGVDMTTEQLEVARRYEDYQREQFGYSKSNVAFRQGYIEDLVACGIDDDSVDVVISNCVINLSPDKERVFKEIYRVLKPGGELYFSDVFSDRRIPVEIVNDEVVRGECLGGALYVEDFRRLMEKTGFLDFRYATICDLTVDDLDIAIKTGNIRFTSRTVRAFKLASLEDRGEDYRQVAIYEGVIPGYPHHFDLDCRYHFVTGKPTFVCGNTAMMLKESRYGRAFSVLGDRTVHYGLFDRPDSVGGCADGCESDKPASSSSCCC